jgi:LysR family hydrogen peroxide-inducible transcriptional activator|tara:strand:+ start:6802 stop:7761 length:960 start_codon:yes stop_codon:yes gene_type:complete
MIINGETIMTLTELRYIVTLAESRHFGEAAKRCNVSQPTLSIAVKKLETELSVELFERSKNRVFITPLGEKIIAQSHLVLEEVEKIKDVASAGKDQLATPLHVGAIFTIGPYLFPHFIPNLQEFVPQMPLIVEEGFTSTLRERLRCGVLDVIIVALPFDAPDVVVQPLYSEPFVLLLPKTHPLAKQASIKSTDLDNENVLLLGEGHCFGDQVRLALPNLNKHPGKIRTESEGSSLETLRHMVASGLGITILPFSAATGSGYSDSFLTTRPFEELSLRRSTALAWRASFPRHKAIDALREAIKRNPLPGCRSGPTSPSYK